jgi:hypothetical protein
MIKYLIYIGLAVTPFITIKGMDSRLPKEYFALGVAATIALLAVSNGSLKSLQNKWLVAFVLWCIFITPFAQKWIGLSLYGGGNVDGLWNYKVLLYSTIYLVALVAISSIKNVSRIIPSVMNVMFYSGFVMSLYVILQSIGIDPLFKISTYEATKYIPSNKLAGTLGHPSIVAMFILVCIPAAIFLKKRYSLLLMISSLLLTKSMISIGALALSTMFLFFFDKRHWLIVVFLFFVFLSTIFQGFIISEASGRYDVWLTALNDIKQNPITILTGFGIGGFSFIFQPLMHGNMEYWASLHNEYLQVLWGVGIVGLFLLIRSIYWVFKNSFNIANDFSVRCLATSFFAICICAAGNFIWQHGTFCIYSIIIVGILCSLIRESKMRVQQ